MVVDNFINLILYFNPEYLRSALQACVNLIVLGKIRIIREEHTKQLNSLHISLI